MNKITFFINYDNNLKNIEEKKVILNVFDYII